MKIQFKRDHLLLAFVLTVSLCGGCGGGGSLVNTSWTVAEIHAKTDADQAALLNVKSVFVEFLGDGRLRTSVKHADGIVEREDRETYHVDGDTIIVTHPDYERRVKASVKGDTMTISSKRFNARLVRYVAPEISQPAMFRPSSVGRTPNRSVSGISAAVGRR